MTEQTIEIPEEHIEWITDTAKICHGVERAYCAAIREDVKEWEALKDADKERVISRVAYCILYPNAKPSAFHDSWMMKMLIDGWVFGKTYNAESKTHPQLKPFHHLPTEQQAKDHIFRAVVHQTSVIK